MSDKCHKNKKEVYYNMKKNTYIIKLKTILENEIIPLYYDFIFCHIFGNKKLGFALMC